MGEGERLGAAVTVVDQAFLEIRDSRLYRENYSTFEAYCRERWGMSKTHSNRLIDASDVVRTLTPSGVIPTYEAQARELAPLRKFEQPTRQIGANAACSVYADTPGNLLHRPTPPHGEWWPRRRHPV
jgi:hypothetical protein